MGGWSRSDSKANSVQLLLQLPIETELGNNGGVFLLCLLLLLLLENETSISQREIGNYMSLGCFMKCRGLLPKRLSISLI